MASQELSVPIKLEVGVTKTKTHYLNLNGYRNWQFQLNNQLKKLFKITVAEDIRNLKPVGGPIRITYKIFYPTKRAFDVDNIGAVISKFTMDALVEFGVLEDDNYTIVPEVRFEFGGIDKDNPRCDVTLEELPNAKQK